MDSASEPPEKKVKRLNEDNCIICFKKLNIKDKSDDCIKKPTKQGLEAIINMAFARKDDVYKLLWPHKREILDLDYKVAFHKSCRASYTSKTSLKYLKTETKSDLPSTSNAEREDERLLRQNTASFDIRNHCFICGKGSTWKQKLISITTGTGSSTHSKVLEAATQRADDVVMMRMLSHTDLFAFDAKYHRNCYSHYITPNNIKAACRKLSSNTETINEKVFAKLTSSIEQLLFSKHLKVIFLSTLCEDYNKMKADFGEETSPVLSWKLKKKILSHFGDRISFIERPGKSDIVCSSAASLGAALRKATELQEQLDQDQSLSEDDIDDTNLEIGDHETTYILHRAAGILREAMLDITEVGNEYVSAAELNFENCKKFVPDALLKFVSWCISEDHYLHMTNLSQSNKEKKFLKCLAVCHDIISLNRNIQTPLTTGLAIQMHHDYGSKQLIDILESFGHSASYDEVRRFLTSAASEQIKRSDEVYVPKGIQRVQKDKPEGMIRAAIDNFDQNEETLDGKSTTHAMAVVIYQTSDNDSALTRISRVSKKALDMEEALALETTALDRYNKPHVRPEPHVVKSENGVQSNTNDPVYIDARIKDLTWEMSRICSKGKHTIPSWSAFNAALSVSEVKLTTIRYLPFVRAPPTDLSTIYTTLLKLVSIAEHLGQEHVVVTADLAIYSKAQQIIWSRPERLDGKVTMQLGGMHLTMAFIASIGKLFGDGGLLDLLSSSGVYAEGTAKQMLQGKHLSRGIRGIKLVLEALSHFYVESAKHWAQQQNIDWISDDVMQKLNDLQDSFKPVNKVTGQQICLEVKPDMIKLDELLHKFEVVGRKKSSTFMYWDNFLKAAHILLRYLRSEREADFQLHLNTVCEMLPWLRAADRNNYGRYVPVYVAEMKSLKACRPNVYSMLNQGGFVVKRSDNNSFNTVPTDQALEQTINRECKSTGGVIGFTLRKAALTRWLLTRHITGEYSESIKCLSGSKNSLGSHQELGNTRRTRDETDVERIIDLITSQYQNPFDLESTPTALINIATGQVASEVIQLSLTTFLKKAAAQTDKLFQTKLLAGKKTVSFWQSEPRCNTLTFANMCKPLKADKSNKLLLDSEVLFRRLFAVSKQRDVDLKTILQHELAAVPPSLFHDDGTMRKTNKADLAKKLESTCEEVYQLPQSSAANSKKAYIIDGMCLLQGLNEAMFKTYDDIAKLVAKKLLDLLNGRMKINKVILVFDRYDNANSIKQMERRRRGDLDMKASHQISGTRCVPNYRQFMKNSANKSALAQFVSEYIVSTIQNEIPQNKVVVLAGGFSDGKVAKEITHNTVMDLQGLFSTQEEADTRMLLHAVDLSDMYKCLIVRSDDTDVLVLLIHYFGKGLLPKQVFMHAGHASKIITRERFIPIHTIVGKIGATICACLPAVHALSGCDTTSSIHKIGKRTAYSKLFQFADRLVKLGEFGAPGNLEEDLKVARVYLIILYGKQNCTCVETLDDLRYILASTTDKPASLLPPTEDAFRQHVERARLQTAIWCSSHLPNPEIWDPVGAGYSLREDGLIEPTTYLKECAPLEVRDLTHLYCTDKDCATAVKCQCFASGIPCIESCICFEYSCNNATMQEDNSDEDSSEEEMDRSEDES